MIDTDFKPILIEINANPALSLGINIKFKLLQYLHFYIIFARYNNIKINNSQSSKPDFKNGTCLP